MRRPRTDKNKKTHCVHGHKFTTESSYVDIKGYRSCRICRKISMMRYRTNQS